jgi:hypothetical protein
MSADFEKVLVKDARLDVHDSIKYAVIKGGQNVTMAQYPAISQSSSQLIFNIQVPSEQTLIDRRVLLQTDLTLTVQTTDISGGYINNNASSCLYGQDSSLAAFPLHQLMTVLSATINNNTVSLNVRDALPAILRVLDCDDLHCYNGMTPTFADTLGSYTQGANSLCNPNASYWAVNNPKIIPRGTFPFKYYSKTQPAGAAFGVVNEVFTWTLTEPLLISPFIFSNLKANNQAFYGIQNLNIVVNIGNADRVFRGFNGAPSTASSNALGTTYAVPSPALSAASGFAAVPWINNVSGGATIPGAGAGAASTNIPMFANTRLLFNFLTPHPSDLMPARNIVPFYELPRYITSIGNQVEPATWSTANGLAQQSVLVPQAFNFSINSLQLNQIPDKLIFYIRQAASGQSYGSPDVAFPITGISINFNNNSGILATAQPVDLWQMSRNNGLNSSWLEFSGLANNRPVVLDDYLAPAVAATPTESRVRAVQTVGSYVVLEFGKDIQLVEDFYAAGSLGNFNLQMNVYGQNTYGYAIGAGQLECVLITMNSGVFVCERGTSSTYTGILTKQDVLEASQQAHYTQHDVARLVGGFNFMGMLKSGVQKLAPMAKSLGNKALDAGKDWAKGQFDKHKGAVGDAAMGALGNARGRAEGAISSAVGRATGSRSSRRGRGYDDGLDGHLM